MKTMDSFPGSLQYHQLREAGQLSRQAADRQVRFPEAFARRLSTDAVLTGHSGCVNRLAWNQEGSLLASGSDDRQVMIWRYPATETPPLRLETHHEANIFGVAFLPLRCDRSIVSGGMDCTVQLHHIDHSPTAPRPPSNRARQRNGSDTSTYLRRLAMGQGAYTQPVDAHTEVYRCHKGRVKNVEVEPGNPHMFWSASEDGTVRQFDTRCDNQSNFESPNVLLGVRQKSRLLDLLMVGINKVRPEQMAIACSDPFVRVYDRRMLNAGLPDIDVSAEPMLKLAPPHMCLMNSRKTERPNTTYVSFSNLGDKVVASYHGDHAYSFDITRSSDGALQAAFSRGSATAAVSDRTTPLTQPLFTIPGRMPQILASTAPNSSSTAVPLPERAETAKNEGNYAFFNRDEQLAIGRYSQAIHWAPWNAVLYANRAAALLQRDWLADAWAALQDCERAIQLDPAFLKAHSRRVQALNALGQLQAAKEAAEAFTQQFPDHAEDVARVQRAIAEELEARSAKAAAKSQRAASMRTQRAQEAASPSSQTGGEGEPARRAEGGDPSPMDEGSDDDSDDEAAAASTQEGSLRDEERARLLREAGPSGSQGLLYTDARVAEQMHRVLQRFIGHCNVQTDIKEATFMGGRDELVAAGSDDGRVFIYKAETGRVICALEADEDVANCVQPHPWLPVLATSGIESVIRLWSPKDAAEPPTKNVAPFITRNQERLKDGASLLRGVTPRILAALSSNPELLNMLLQRRDRGPEPAGEDPAQTQEVACRVN